MTMRPTSLNMCTGYLPFYGSNCGLKGATTSPQLVALCNSILWDAELWSSLFDFSGTVKERMTMSHLLNKVTKFFKESYSPKLRRVLFGILILGLAGIWIASNSQHSTIDQRIAERKMQIGQEREQKEIGAQQYYDECLQKESTKPKGQFYFSPCFHPTLLPLETEYQYDKSLHGLGELKSNLESGFFYFIFLLCLAAFTVAIPVVRLLWLIGKMSWRKSKAATASLRSESVQMSSFQKYSLVLSALILVALITMILILLT